MSCRVKFDVVRSALQNSAFANALPYGSHEDVPLDSVRFLSTGPSLNRVYTIREVEVRFRGLLAN